MKKKRRDGFFEELQGGIEGFWSSWEGLKIAELGLRDVVEHTLGYEPFHPCYEKSIKDLRYILQSN